MRNVYGYERDKCEILNQSGTQDRQYCGDVESINCFAEVRYEDGSKKTIWGGCTSEYYNCFWNGSDRVDPKCAQ